VAFFDFKIISKSDRKVNILLMMAARNTVGYETLDRFYTTEIKETAACKAVSMGCGGMSEKASSWGQIALASLAADSSHYCGWSPFILIMNRCCAIELFPTWTIQMEPRAFRAASRPGCQSQTVVI